MYPALSPGAIHVQTTGLEDAIAKAKRHGFAGVEFNPAEVADLIEQRGAAAVNRLFVDAGVKPAGCGLPGRWREADEGPWREDLGKLPRLAEAIATIGCRRVSTWILPCGDRPFDDNYRFHVTRLEPMAKVLANHGIDVGLEFIGPKTLRDSKPYPFVHTMFAMLRMAAEIGPNVGLLLDVWHWYTAHQTLDDLKQLTPKQVVYVHINDAPAGVPVDEQVDNRRALPGETGVIDIRGFLRALQSIGYDGPVVCEPFSADLKAMPDDEARLSAVATAVKKVLADAGS